jgi:hypothetical protein
MCHDVVNPELEPSRHESCALRPLPMRVMCAWMGSWPLSMRLYGRHCERHFLTNKATIDKNRESEHWPGKAAGTEKTEQGYTRRFMGFT